MKARIAAVIYRYRFLLCAIAAMWLVVLCVPPLRMIFQVHTSREPTYWPAPPWAQYGSSDDSNYVAPIERWPNDRDVQIADAETDSLGGKYEKLLRVQPNDLMLLASRLKNPQINSARLQALTNPAYAAQVKANAAAIAAAAPIPTVALAFPTKTEDQKIAHLILLARRGHRLDPNNVYFTQMLMYLLFCAGRNEEAVRVLDVSPTRPFYKDYVRETMASCVRAREKARVLMVEEKQAIINGSTLPHLSKMREAARGALQIADNAEKSGDRLRALRLRYELMRAGYVRMRDGDWAIISSTGGSQIAMAMRRPGVAFFKVKTTNNTLTAAQYTRQMQPVLNHFRRFALSLNRADMAREVDFIATQRVVYYVARDRYVNQNDYGLVSLKIILLKHSATRL